MLMVLWWVSKGANATKGDWQLQVDFIPGAADAIVGVSYSQFSGKQVWCAGYKVMCGTYSHTVYPLTLMPSDENRSGKSQKEGIAGR